MTTIKDMGPRQDRALYAGNAPVMISCEEKGSDFKRFPKDEGCAGSFRSMAG